jgi:hypothetical protein
MKWIPVTERLPEPSEYPHPELLVWVAYESYPEHSRAMIAAFRATRLIHEWVGDEVFSEELTDPNFQWAGGDNDRQWPTSLGFLGLGGYGFGNDEQDEHGPDRITHWMPLPEAP